MLSQFDHDYLTSFLLNFDGTVKLSNQINLTLPAGVSLYNEFS